MCQFKSEGKKKTDVPDRRQSDRRHSLLLIGGSAFLFFWGLQLIRRGLSTLRRAICFTQSTNSSFLKQDSFFFFKVNHFLKLIYLFWLCWVFVSVRGLSPAAASGGHSSSWCVGLSPSRPLLLWSTGSRCAGSVVVAHGPSRSTACGILPDQGSNPCPLHWQADSQPPCHQGSPKARFFFKFYWVIISISHCISPRCIIWYMYILQNDYPSKFS